jgi:branched-subunit amino acid ABC-type transport system permease component
MMEGCKKRKLAKEWLIFVCCFVPSVIFLTYVTRKEEHPFLELLLVILFPYILVQFIRSIVWSIKTWKAPKTELPMTDRKPMDFKVWVLDLANVLIIAVAILLAVIIYCFSTRYQIKTTSGEQGNAYVLDRMTGKIHKYSSFLDD